MSARLDVDADLVLSSPAGEVRVRGHGCRLVGEMHGRALAWQILRFGPGRLWRRSALGGLDAALRRAEIDLELHWNGRIIALMGPSARSRRPLRLMGPTPVELRPAAWLLSFLDSLNPARI